MPFKEVYSVNFSNGNLIPQPNLNNWATMTLSDQIIADPEGIILECNRVDSNSPGNSSAYINFPDGMPTKTRLLMITTFDLPTADPDPGQWAVVLAVSPEINLSSPYTVDVTCQFNKVDNGVRLNTPKPGKVQLDTAAFLESPLDYSRYLVRPRTPVFTLKHSFCGGNLMEIVDNVQINHTASCGFLEIARHPHSLAEDHRVFSDSSLFSKFESNPQNAAIRALGVSVANTGIGKVSARVRTFSVWINESL